MEYGSWNISEQNFEIKKKKTSKETEEWKSSQGTEAVKYPMQDSNVNL